MVSCVLVGSPPPSSGDELQQVTQYYPSGLPWWEGRMAETQNRKFNGKEFVEAHGYDTYDYGARGYYPAIMRFTTVDPLAEKYYSVSPYAYCGNNPVKYIDPDGLYPRSVLIYDPKLGLYGGYKFTQSAAQLLSLVSGVSRIYIDNTVVQERATGQYRPFYSASKGGGAMTLGSGVLNSNITYTENFFDDNPTSYSGHGYGQNVMEWLSLSAHEVGHLPQIGKADGLLNYLFGFVVEYAKSGHDDAPREIEADKGYKTFTAFNSFVNKTYGNGSMEKLFNSDARESKKVETITKWWSSYQDKKLKINKQNHS
jgi:RHS repeat-associated protein